MSNSSDDGSALAGFFLIMILFLITLPLWFIGCAPHYSDGTRTGVVTKISHKGILWKTWEGQLNFGGMVQGDKGMVANVWDFTVESPSLVDTLNQAAASGKQVSLHYHQYLKRPVQSTDSGYMVDEVMVEGVSENQVEKKP